MKNYQVWVEGYSATGDRSTASLAGMAKASSFKEACEKVYKDDRYFDSKDLTYWGCRLFDNWDDASKSFG